MRSGCSSRQRPLRYRPVTIVNASAPKQLKLRIEVPVEDMARLNAMEEIPSGPASQMPRRVSIWNAIHPRLLELIRERNSTILFVNSRQVAERLAGALNDLAGEPIARAHHGSLAADQRSVIEEQLKAGQIKALCATSTLELGIDMGAVDLVIQIEAPPSVASGMQRIGRAGHSRRRGQRGHSVSQVPRRPGRLRRRHARHARGPHRVHALPAQSARRPRPATGGHRRPPARRAKPSRSEETQASSPQAGCPKSRF